MFPHPVFQVAGHAHVGRSLGFAGHDVEGGLFYDRCLVMDSRLRGNDGGQRRNGGESFAGMAGGQRRNDRGGLCGNRWESMIAVLVLHDNTASFPRRRESIDNHNSW